MSTPPIAYLEAKAWKDEEAIAAGAAAAGMVEEGRAPRPHLRAKVAAAAVAAAGGGGGGWRWRKATVLRGRRW
jgi:hypothetical protein